MATATRKPKVSVNARHTRQASTQRSFGLCLASAVLVLAGAFLYLWPHMRLVELGYEHSVLRQHRAKLLEQQQEYEVEIASLSRPGRIEKMAGQMGLRPPRVSQIIYLQQATEPVAPRPVAEEGGK
jgi:cell division protein FtsL